MTDTETIDDIVRNMRAGVVVPHHRDEELLRYYADRIEAARRRETAGIAAMREALNDAHRMIEAFLATVGDRGMRSEFIEMRYRIRAALAGGPDSPWTTNDRTRP